jgi:SAM-dependent methyltransferase
MFDKRSNKLERIDTGDYTEAEYERFLLDIRLVNKFAGDTWALKKTLLREIKESDLEKVSVLDIGAGSGELLREIAKFSRNRGIKADLLGLELNEISANSIRRDCAGFDEIAPIRANALSLPFADKSFDYAISSLFAHHLTDENILLSLSEMQRVARKGIFIIDLHRHPMAYALYKAFCIAFGISRLVREDGSLSILRGFKPKELGALAEKAKLENPIIERHFPFRLILRGS